MVDHLQKSSKTFILIRIYFQLSDNFSRSRHTIQESGAKNQVMT